MGKGTDLRFVVDDATIAIHDGNYDVDKPGRFDAGRGQVDVRRHGEAEGVEVGLTKEGGHLLDQAEDLSFSGVASAAVGVSTVAASIAASSLPLSPFASPLLTALGARGFVRTNTGHGGDCAHLSLSNRVFPELSSGGGGGDDDFSVPLTT